jgi:ATP-dependent DNA ligase
MASRPDDHPRRRSARTYVRICGASRPLAPPTRRSRLTLMRAPKPMLSTAIRSWPQGGDWMLEPKFDGFRVLIEVVSDRRVRAWSRHGTNLTESVGDLLRAFDAVPAGTVIDGELVALTERNGRPAQNFAAVCRAVLNGDSQAAGLLQYVAFDLLSCGGADLRDEAWRERRGHLGEVLPTGPRVRRIDCLPATLASHAAMIELGFEGSVLKRPGSSYRAGRHRSWRKLKARHVAQGVLESVRVGREGRSTRSAMSMAGTSRRWRPSARASASARRIPGWMPRVHCGRSASPRRSPRCRRSAPSGAVLEGALSWRKGDIPDA